MGAYENPITVIDRESGQIWANAIAGVGQQTVNVIEKQAAKQSAKQKEIQKQLAAEADYVINNQQAFTKDMAKNGINNPSLFNAGKSLIDEMARASTAIKGSKTREQQQAALNNFSKLQKQYNNLTQGIQIGGDADATYKQDRIDSGQKGWKKPGEQGGMSVTGETTQAFIKRMNVRNGLGQGAIEEYIPQPDGTYNLRYSGGIYGDEVVEVPMIESLSYDAGVVPDAKARVMEAFTTESGAREDGTTFAILNDKGKYSEEYLDYKNTFEQKGKVNEDGSYASSTIVPANTSLIVSASIGKINAVSESYLSDYNEANKVWMEVLNNEEPLKRASGGNVSPEDQAKFKEEMLKYGQSMLPSFEITDQKENVDYGKRISTKIKEAKKASGKKEDKKQAVKEVANELVTDLVEDTESFLSRYLDKDDFAMNQGPGVKGFSVIEVDNKGNESRYTYDLTNPSDIERFFRLEIDLGTKAEETKILNEINKIAGVSKANTQTSELSAKDLLTKYSN
jgi:hypothetical protein